MSMFRQIEWTDEQVANFWNYKSQNGAQDYFTDLNGNGVIQKIKSRISLNQIKVMDFGAGPGFLTKKLLDAGASVFPLDFSPDSLAALKLRCPNVEKTILYSEEASSLDVDLITFIETIEHLSEEKLTEVFTKLKGYLKKDGILFVTCPNDEDLSKSMICCPNCNTEFHRVQHMRSLNASSLANILERYGFESIEVGVTNFKYSGLKGYFFNKLKKLKGKKFPHLYAFARLKRL